MKQLCHKQTDDSIADGISRLAIFSVTACLLGSDTTTNLSAGFSKVQLAMAPERRAPSYHLYKGWRILPAPLKAGCHVVNVYTWKWKNIELISEKFDRSSILEEARFLGFYHMTWLIAGSPEQRIGLLRRRTFQAFYIRAFGTGTAEMSLDELLRWRDDAIPGRGESL